MTRMLDSLAQRPAAQRVLLAIVLGTLGMFLIGLAVGVVAAMISKGHLPSRLWVTALPIVAAPLGALSIYAAWRLAAPPATASGYEKRYWRTWLVVTALGVPVGMVLAMSSRRNGVDSINPFTSDPISPPIAVLLAVLVTGFFALAVGLYHRTIDDHEERAYLWGSQLAYYFLVLAVPAWWLLERGGIVEPISTTTAFIAILVSFLVQGAIWAWLKFR
jgi:hypothetical protein